MKPVMTITVDRLRVYAHHGVAPQERTVGNIFEVTASVDIPPVATDHIDATVSYAELAELIRREMAIESMLLEHVCIRLRDAIAIAFPQVTGGKVAVSKLTPPIPGTQMAAATVSITW